MSFDPGTIFFREARDKAREARLTRLESAIDATPASAVRAALDLK